MIDLIRCDDRLIHGQCMNMIVKQYDVKTIIVVDNVNASNAILRKIFESAVPATMKVKLTNEENSSEVIKKSLENKDHTIILMRSPKTAQYLFEHIPLLKRDLNVANLNSKNHKYTVTQYAYCDDEEIDALNIMMQAGVHIWFNQIPGKPVLEWKELQEKL